MDRSQILDDFEQTFKIALDGRQSEIWTALPCVVVSVNWNQMTIVAQATVQGVITDQDGNQTFEDLPPFGDVPLMFPSAGGFALTLPLVPGDEVLVVFASRAIDSWWQVGGTENPPIENRQHDLSDGFAIPAQMSNPKVANYGPNVSTTNARLTSQGGEVYLEITPDGICNIQADGGINLNGAVSVNGNLAVTGSIDSTGGISGNGTALSTHIHSAGTLTNGGGAVSGDTGVPT